MKNISPTISEMDKLDELKSTIKRKRNSASKTMLKALDQNKYKMAYEYFKLSVKYNQLYELSNNSIINTKKQNHPVFMLDYWFLQDLIKCLTPGPDEVAVFVVGNDFDNIRMPYRICDVELEKQSVVYARATAKSCSDVLIDLFEKGYKIQLVAHSHPGRGPEATRPSSIDINYLAKIQDAGSDAVGLIVTRDGYVRFFTVRTEYEISIKGKGVQYVEENVFKIPLV